MNATALAMSGPRLIGFAVRNQKAPEQDLRSRDRVRISACAVSHARINEERAMRRRKLKWLWARLKEIASMDLDREELADAIARMARLALLIGAAQRHADAVAATRLRADPPAGRRTRATWARFRSTSLAAPQNAPSGLPRRKSSRLEPPQHVVDEQHERNRYGQRVKGGTVFRFHELSGWPASPPIPRAWLANMGRSRR
jgi:hypothetical protein